MADRPVKPPVQSPNLLHEDEVPTERWISPRERLEAELPKEALVLADDLRDRLYELGHHDFGNRRALLLDLAKVAYERLKG